MLLSSQAAESLAAIYGDEGVDDAVTEEITARETAAGRRSLCWRGLPPACANFGISEHTVKFHISSILDKLGASTRTEAVTVGIRRGLILI